MVLSSWPLAVDESQITRGHEGHSRAGHGDKAIGNRRSLTSQGLSPLISLLDMGSQESEVSRESNENKILVSISITA